MNKDDIIKMAKEYADEVTNGYGVVTYEFDLYGLEKFALLIRAAERERIIAANAPEIEKVNVYIKTLEDAAEALRARLAGWERVNMNDHKEGDLGIGTKPYAAQAAMVASQTQGRMSVDPVTGDVSIGTVKPQRDEAPAKAVEWQGLTDEEIKKIEMSASSKLSAIYLAEAQLKGKNYDKS